MSTVGRALIFLVGVVDTLAGAVLLFVPEWFFETIGHFPPFNRHYLGDAGSFLLPIGVGLIVAASSPARYRPIIWLALAASWIHAANHTFDALANPGMGQASLLDAANVIAIAVALTVGAFLVGALPVVGGPAGRSIGPAPTATDPPATEARP